MPESIYNALVSMSLIIHCPGVHVRRTEDRIYLEKSSIFSLMHSYSVKDCERFGSSNWRSLLAPVYCWLYFPQRLIISQKILDFKLEKK